MAKHPQRTRAQATRALRHPADRRDGPRRTSFDRLAERASFLPSSALFFSLCLVIVAAWALGLILGASSRIESAAAGLMSAMTLILVALLKNAELRSERAIQHKLDAIAGSLLDERRGQSGDSEDELESAIRIHEQI